MAEDIHRGRCHCGAISFEVEGAPMHHALCHCRDCRTCAGAPYVAWFAVREEQFRLTGGVPVEYASSEHGRRSFCGHCGTGLAYRNAAMLPGIVDVQSALLDDIDALAPQAQIQRADRIAWIDEAPALPGFDRFPG